MNWKKSILLKVAVLFVLLGSITAIFMGTVSYASAKHAITKNVYNTHKDVVWQISKSIDSEIQKNLAIIASLYYDENLKRLFEEKYTTEYDFIKKQASANEIVRQTKNTHPLNNCNIILFDADGNIYGTVADGLDISWLEEKPYFSQLSDSRSIIWEGGVRGIGKNNAGRNVISAVKAVEDSHNRILYYIVAETDEKVFYDIYKGTLNLNNTICIVDEYGTIASSSEREQLGEAFLDRYKIAAEELESGLDKKVRLDNTDYMVLKKQIAGTNWWIVDMVPLKQMTEEVFWLRMVLAIFIILMIGLTIALTWGLMIYFGRPIRQLEQCMTQVTKGSFSMHMDYRREDEIKVLADGFNMMVEDLKIYMRDLVYQQQLLRSAELKAMQAQIRPHFLYNTLESISYLSQMGENAKIKVMTQSLIGLLRMTVGDIRTTVTLQEELEGVKQYINIQNIRYGNTLKESIYAEPETEGCRILKLLLQPVVENAIIHGIAPLGSPGVIMIYARREEQGICIEISDNGMGMEPGEAESLLADGKREGNFSGIGIANVQQRIRALYGKDYGLVIYSQPGNGTTVEVHLPFVADEGEEGKDEQQSETENINCGG